LRADGPSFVRRRRLRRLFPVLQICLTAEANYFGGVYVASGPTLNASHTSMPSTDNYVDHKATFNDQWGWYSDKDSYLHAYGSGSCSLAYTSYGIVPWGGGVSADLTYH
jgi:hypothetical protein